MLVGFLSVLLAVAAAPLHAEEFIASSAFYDAYHPTSGRSVIMARDGGDPDLIIYLSSIEEPHSNMR